MQKQRLALFDVASSDALNGAVGGPALRTKVLGRSGSIALAGGRATEPPAKTKKAGVSAHSGDMG